MDWTNYAAEFSFDGSWLDIYLLKTGVAEWQQLLDLLKSSGYTSGSPTMVSPSRQFRQPKKYSNE